MCVCARMCVRERGRGEMRVITRKQTIPVEVYFIQKYTPSTARPERKLTCQPRPVNYTRGGSHLPPQATEHKNPYP